MATSCACDKEFVGAATPAITFDKLSVRCVVGLRRMIVGAKVEKGVRLVAHFRWCVGHQCE